MHSSTHDIVVAACDEDLSWVFSIPPPFRVIVYDKGFRSPHDMKAKPAEDRCRCQDMVVDMVLKSHVTRLNRPNQGREAETFLHHIITHYDDEDGGLAEHTTFLQGNPLPHIQFASASPFPECMLEHLRTLSDLQPKQPVPVMRHLQTEVWQPGWSPYPQYYAMLFGHERWEFAYASGAQYTVPRAAILARPLAFYRKLHEMLVAWDHAANGLCYQVSPGHIDAWIMERLWPYIWDADIVVSG